MATHCRWLVETTPARRTRRRRLTVRLVAASAGGGMVSLPRLAVLLQFVVAECAVVHGLLLAGVETAGKGGLAICFPWLFLMFCCSVSRSAMATHCRWLVVKTPARRTRRRRSTVRLVAASAGDGVLASLCWLLLSVLVSVLLYMLLCVLAEIVLHAF